MHRPSRPEQRRRDDHARSPTLNLIAAYSIIAGAGCLIAVYDGTLQSFLKAFGVFALGALGLAAITSSVGALLRARAESAPADAAGPRERERPTIPLVLVWGRRLVLLAMVFMPALGVVAESDLAGRRADVLPGKLVYMAAALSVICFGVSLKWFNRRIERVADDWRAARTAERAAQRASRPEELPDASTPLDVNSPFSGQ